MEKVETGKDILIKRIESEIGGIAIQKEYLEKYQKIMDTPTVELIAEHIKSGKMQINGTIDLNTELLIRILLKG